MNIKNTYKKSFENNIRSPPGVVNKCDQYIVNYYGLSLSLLEYLENKIAAE